MSLKSQKRHCIGSSCHREGGGGSGRAAGCWAQGLGSFFFSVNLCQLHPHTMTELWLQVAPRRSSALALETEGPPRFVHILKTLEQGDNWFI